MSGSDGMFKIPLIILYIAVSLAVFLLDLRLGKSRDCNIEVTLEYDEKSFKQNLAACLCTDSSLWMFSWCGGPKHKKRIRELGELVTCNKLV